MSVSTSWLNQLIDYNIPRLYSVTSSPQPITAKSVGEFLYACGWGWLLLIAFTGWGRAMARLLRIRQVPAAVACVLGISVAIFLGGLLNLVHAIYTGVLIGLVLIGLVLYVLTRGDRPVEYQWKGFWKRAHPLSRALIIVAILVFLLRAAGTVRMGEFYIADDSAAYLVFPQKMLATHTFAADPFSERRVTSDLGAPYFLQSFVISATSLPHIAMADRGLGLILLAAILFELGIAFRLSAFQIMLLEFLACLVPQETFNLTFIVLPVAILLGLVWMVWRALEQDTFTSFRYSILAGVIGGAVISLKSTYLPITGTLLLIPYLLLLGRRNLKLALQLFLLAALSAVITIAAWMITMKLSSGTYLFPLLGRGLDYSRLHLFHSVPTIFHPAFSQQGYFARRRIALFSLRSDLQ